MDQPVIRLLGKTPKSNLPLWPGQLAGKIKLGNAHAVGRIGLMPVVVCKAKRKPNLANARLADQDDLGVGVTGAIS